MSGWDDYFQHVEFVIGQGNRVSFWKDKWCGDIALMDRFPLLFNCSSNREATKLSSTDLILGGLVIGM